MIDIYKFGNVFEYRGVSDKLGKVRGLGVCDSLQFNGQDVPSDEFQKEAKLTGLSFENFVEMARKKDEKVLLDVMTNYVGIQIRWRKLMNSFSVDFEQDDKESFEAFLLRVEKERGYLTK